MLLLGATGRLGAMLRRFWPQPDDLFCQSREKKTGFVDIDPLSDIGKLGKVSQGTRAILCLSGITPERSRRTGEPMSLNTDLAMAALRAAVDGRVPRLFVASSAAVYGAAPGKLAENADCVPVSPYGEAKRAMERAVLTGAAQSSVAVTILRIGNVAGADAVLGGWRAGMQIDRFPDLCTPHRSYIGPATLARVLYQLSLSETLPEILNIAAPGTIAMDALLDEAGLQWAPRPASGDAIEKVELSTRILERHVAFPSVASTARTMVAEWREMEKN
jgi:nucleoside-diphosphate-sugar epimerase